MEMPLTPMDFARRARQLYADREAVVDGDLRLTYVQFLERCNRWSATLQALGVRQGDRVAYIAPNTHAHLEAYYSVPQIGAVLVPINYRLLPDDFEYIINHCSAKIVCAHSDYIEAFDGIRDRLSGVEHFVSHRAAPPQPGAGRAFPLSNGAGHCLGPLRLCGNADERVRRHRLQENPRRAIEGPCHRKAIWHRRCHLCRTDRHRVSHLGCAGHAYQHRNGNGDAPLRLDRGDYW